jgi:DNA-directed RNA polymerase specialized sigma24 family protein
MCADPLTPLMLQGVMQSLSAEDQRLCMLRYMMGYSHREIAATLGIGVSTSKSRLNAVRTRLRREWQGQSCPRSARIAAVAQV